MLWFLVRRLAWIVVVLFGVVTMLFVLMRSIGGSPLRKGLLLGFTNRPLLRRRRLDPQTTRSCSGSQLSSRPA